MQINCPNCHTVYNINPDVIPEGGRKLRCTNCNEIFWCNPNDLENPTRKIEEVNKPQESILDNNESNPKTEPKAESEAYEEETEVNVSEDVNNGNNDENSDTLSSESDTDVASDTTDEDMQHIFQRLSLQSEQISKLEQEMSFYKKICGKIKDVTGWHNKTNRIMVYVIFCVIILLGIFYARFEIAKKAPFMANVFSAIGINAKIPGYGLKFSNVSRREFLLDDIPQMEVKGFIDNTSNSVVEVQNLRWEILDEDGDIIQQQNIPMVQNKIPVGAKVPFSFDIVKPSALGRYVVVTFSD